MSRRGESIEAQQYVAAKSLSYKDLAHQLTVDFQGYKRYIECYSNGRHFCPPALASETAAPTPFNDGSKQ
jgi:hypothetical protein